MTADYITASQLTHQFHLRNDDGEIVGEIPALCGIDLTIPQGSFAAILGANGSGKSTFAKHINVLLRPQSGSLTVGGLAAADEENTWEIRKRAGMIFQNPDNQLVAGVMEEDVAFGLENIGMPTEDMQARIIEALASVHMEEMRMRSPNHLSGGQKQRVAIAGIVAMRPDCIVFDESTAMLDPDGRREVLQTARELNKTNGVTVIWITHFMEEVTQADVVYVFAKGRVCMSGTPREVFARAKELMELGLDLPSATRLALALKSKGLDLPDGILDREELVEALCRLHAAV